MMYREWQTKAIDFFEQVTNLFFYLMALLIIFVPILKWIADLFPSTDDPLWVMASIIVFVFIIPAIVPSLAHITFGLLERFKKGEILPIVFKPLKGMFSLLSIYAVLALEYKVIHGDSDKTLGEVFWELLKAF